MLWLGFGLGFGLGLKPGNTFVYLFFVAVVPLAIYKCGEHRYTVSVSARDGL